MMNMNTDLNNQFKVTEPYGETSSKIKVLLKQENKTTLLCP